MISIEELPIKYKEFLGSHITALKVLRLADRYSISKERLPDFSRLVAEVFLKTYKLADLPGIIQKDYKISGGKSFLLAAELTEQFFSQFPTYFGNLDALINQWQLWGRQLGSRGPKKYGTPLTEKLIQAQGQNRGARFEEPADVAISDRKTFDLRKKLANAKKDQKNTADIPAKRLTPEKKSRTSSEVAPRAVQVGDAVAGLQEESLTPRAPRPSHVSRSTAKPKAKAGPNIGREQFLRRIQGFDINVLRPEGKSAAARLGQVATRLNQVLKNNPEDRAAIAAALKKSKLFELYQDQGRGAAQSGQSLDQVIYSRYQSQKPYLLKEEFEAVANIIKSLQ